MAYLVLITYFSYNTVQYCFILRHSECWPFNKGTKIKTKVAQRKVLKWTYGVTKNYTPKNSINRLLSTVVVHVRRARVTPSLWDCTTQFNCCARIGIVWGKPSSSSHCARFVSVVRITTFNSVFHLSHGLP